MDNLPKPLKAYIIATLRRIGYRNVYRKAAFDKAHIGRAQWECQLCKKIYSSSRDLHGDHYLPCVDVESGFTTWDEYINRLFLGEIQAICKECHKIKTNKENEQRRKRD